MRNLRTIGAIGAMSLALTGCATATTGAADDRLEIVATTTQLADIARGVVGDGAQVTSLLQPGQTAHAFDPGPALLSALAEADLLVVNGAGLETWLDDTVDASGFDGVIVDTSEDIDLIGAAEGGEAAQEAEPADAEADEPALQAEGAFDPHVWTDPANAIVQAEAIRDAVTAAGPDADIDASAAAYIDRLTQLEEWMRASVEQVPVDERLLVMNHDTFAYFARAFDARIVGTVLPSVDDNADASAAHLDDLVAQIRGSGVRVVFSETSIDPQLAATIAREAGVELRQGEEALSADALGEEGSPTGTYIGSQIHNTTAMVTAWGVEPLPVPESLS